MLQGDVTYQQYKRYTAGSTDSLTEFKLGENYSSIVSVRGSLILLAILLCRKHASLINFHDVAGLVITESKTAGTVVIKLLTI